MTTAERNRTDRQRKRASLQLTALLVAYKHRCHWCGESLIQSATVPAEQILGDSGEWLVWKRSGRATPVRRLKATVDHLKPIREGGTNYRTNLVPACGPCNRKRTPVVSPKSIEERWLCPKCGNRKDDYRRKHCYDCRQGDPTRHGQDTPQWKRHP